MIKSLSQDWRNVRRWGREKWEKQKEGISQIECFLSGFQTDIVTFVLKSSFNFFWLLILEKEQETGVDPEVCGDIIAEI